MSERAFSGGDKLEAKLREIAEKLSKAGTLRVGFLEGATYPAYSRKETRAAYAKKRAKGDTSALEGAVGGESVAMVAAIMEFGAPEAGIPPRPYFRTMIKEKSDGWADAVGRNLVAQDYDTERALKAVGIGIEGQLRESIIATDSPALKPATIEAKGFAKPLVDTGHMLASVGSEVTT